jgi:hypothetical protein
LIHQFLIWAIIHHTFAKDRRRELAIDFLGVQVGMLAVENEMISLFAEKHRRGFPEEDKSVAISVPRSAVREKSVRVHAILNCTANKWEEVEHHWRPVRVCKEELADHIVDNCNQPDEREAKEDGKSER